MVWAAFWHGNKTPLYALDCDFAAKKHGYSAASCLKVLEDNAEYIQQDETIFMQDNAPIHTAAAVRKWFEEKGVKLME